MVARRWKLLIYGACGLAGLAFAFLSVQRHGFSKPVSFANACAMVFLSLMCFLGTLRSATPLTKRKYVIQTS